MSVLNQSGEEQVECPLCMEPLEVDDLNFFPCTCGYQICRFCWHRIRTDENGLCPACRKAYSENPADFIPLSQEQVAKLKAEKRQRDQQRKAKLSENRKHLASVRVVQRNLVFVVGLPMRLAEPEVLKRHEYFGKFGKIHKVVINQSTSYAGTQGPSASAYVTYMKSDDALRAIQSVNNITIDGRLIKSSLGTTKYCSHFMKNQTCPKPDCMYLHDFGDPEASFTKEQMHACKHQEYEKKLHENLVQKMANNNNCNHHSSENSKQSVPIPTGVSSKSSSKESIASLSSSVGSSSSSASSGGGGTNKENWPHLNTNEKEKRDKEKGKKSKTKGGGQDGGGRKERREAGHHGKSEGRFDKNNYKMEAKDKPASPAPLMLSTPSPPPTSHALADPPSQQNAPARPPKTGPPRRGDDPDDNTSFFSSSTNSFRKVSSPGGREGSREEHADAESGSPALLSDAFPDIDTTEDWAAAFGFPRHSDSLGGDMVVNKEEKINLDLLANGFGQLGHNGFIKGVKKEDKINVDPLNNGFGQLGQNGFGKAEPFNNGFYEMSAKLQENIIDLLSSNPTGYKQPPPASPAAPAAQPTPASPARHRLDGLDQNMSKFFMDFHKNKEQQQQQHHPQQTQPQQFSNGGFGRAYYSDMPSEAERIKVLQQRQLEARLMNIASFKQNYQNSTSNPYQNGMNQQLYMNGENGGFGNFHNQIYGSSNVKQNTEDDLGFDPFQETQKALAELMANEQSHKTHNTGHSQINIMIHNQNNGLVPPPPPGFVQQTPSTHMNSFGSKILPYLNMSNSQQQVNSQTPSNNWPSNFSSHPQQQPPKNMSNTCNDWKVLDPAILSSSRHFPLANMSQSNREHYPNLSQIGTQQQIQSGAPLRYDFTNNAFSNFTQQIQPNYNNISHLNSQQNWFSSDINSQISSPPGFRSNQATKQQEC